QPGAPSCLASICSTSSGVSIWRAVISIPPAPDWCMDIIANLSANVILLLQVPAERAIMIFEITRLHISFAYIEGGSRMKPTQACRPENLHYLKMLARQYPTVQAASTEIINLQAILNLPKIGRASCRER